MPDEGSAHGTCYDARAMADRSRAERLQTPAWIAVATVAHAALIASLLLVPIRRERVSPPAAEPTEIAIVLESEATPPGPRADEPSGSATEATRRSAASAAATAERGARTGATTAPSGASSAEPATSTSSGGEGSPSGAPGPASSGGASSGGVSPIPFSAAELGIGPGNNPFLPRAEEKPPESGPDHPAARALRSTGMARDRELGLGPEGPAMTALSEATRTSIAPLRGRAVFLIRAGGDGVVSSVDVIDSEGGSGWVDAGRIALEALRGKKLKVPSGARGMNMRIEVRSDVKLPNGESAPFGVRQGENKMPEFTIPDVSNIGAKPRRVVHAHAVGTDLL